MSRRAILAKCNTYDIKCNTFEKKKRCNTYK